MANSSEAGFGDSPVPAFLERERMSRRQAFKILLAGGSRDGLPLAYVEDFERSRPHW